MSDQPPQNPQPEGQVPDPWAAAQHGGFVYRPGAEPPPQYPGPQQGAGWGEGEQSRWGATPGSRLDTDPYADRKVGPARKAESDEVKIGRRLAMGCAVVGVIVAIIAGIAVVIFFTKSTREGVEAVETGLAIKARVALEMAIRDEQVNLAQYDRFTDDPAELNRHGGQTQYVVGTEVENLDQVAVQLCEAVDGVLLQKKASTSVYFAVFMNRAGAVPYWARGQQLCPEAVDGNGFPGEPWSTSDAALTGKELPTQPAPKAPTRAPTREPTIVEEPTDPFTTPSPFGY